MNDNFLDISSAAKMTGKHPSTLRKLAAKLERTGEALKDDSGQWLIKESALTRKYARMRSATSANERDNSRDPSGVVERLLAMIEELRKENTELRNENRQLLIGQGKEEKDSTRVILIGVLIALAAALVLVLVLL